MTQMRIDVSTACGRRTRFRTAGPFLALRRRTARSYFDEVGERPTSKARIYLDNDGLDLACFYVGILASVYRMASHNENCAISFRFWLMNSVRAFFFFLG